MCVQVVGGGWIDGWLVGRVDAVRVFMYVCMCAHTAFSACPCGQEFAGERTYVRMYVCMYGRWIAERLSSPRKT
jgi:hypothetical protein